MKDFITKLQKDINKLQDTVQKEGNDLVKKIKKVATKKNIEAQAKDLEHIIAEKLKNFEPALENLYKEVRKSANKAGIDLSKFERELKRKTAAAKKKIKTMKKKTTKKKTTKKKTTKKKATKKKTAKRTTKKKTTKKA